MIIVNKPFIYLRDHHEWKYLTHPTSKHRNFLDPSRIMAIERREGMMCKTFSENSTNKTSIDAEYIPISLLEFLDHCNLEKDILYCQYNVKGAWGWVFFKLGLKVIRNAEIVLPTRENFPLIIRNEKFTVYIAPREKEENKQ